MYHLNVVLFQFVFEMCGTVSFNFYSILIYLSLNTAFVVVASAVYCARKFVRCIFILILVLSINPYCNLFHIYLVFKFIEIKIRYTVLAHLGGFSIVCPFYHRQPISNKKKIKSNYQHYLLYFYFCKICSIFFSGMTL